MMAARHLEVQDLGLLGYGESYRVQMALVASKEAARDERDFLLFVEHPDVITVGRKRPKNALLRTDVVPIERGGEATFHNPGQLVCYPILRLREGERDLRGFLRSLEILSIDLLASFGIPAEVRSGATGVWIRDQERKIASIGIAVRSWITFHGLALNVYNDLSGFSQIAPCGFPPEVMTSMKEQLGERCPTMVAVKQAFADRFRAAFGGAVG